MAILCEYQEEDEEEAQRCSSLSFSAILDPSNPLGFLESVFDFVSQKSAVFKDGKIEKQILYLIRSRKAKIQTEEAEKNRMKLEEKKREERKNLLVPNECNGLDLENYSWEQNLQEVSVTVPVPSGAKSCFVSCEIKKDSLRVGLKGHPPIIDGILYKSVKIEDCFWTLEDQETISIFMTKIEKSDWWKSLLKDGPEIDIQKAEPESSRLSELDNETRSAVEKIMFDRRQTQLGLPTSDEIQNQELLKKFMAQNPTMEFSGPKYR